MRKKKKEDKRRERSGEESGREGKEGHEPSVILFQKSIQGSCCMSKSKVRLQTATLQSTGQ